MDESEGNKSDFDDSSNSASISFIPESATNTPQTSHYLKDFKDVSVSKTPSFQLEPQLLSGKNSPILDLKKPEGSVKRITPLKVHRSYIQEDSSFVKAMANSLIITPETSPRNEQIPLETNASEHASSDEEEDGSPVRFVKKKAVKRIYSDSDESDAESYTRNEDRCSIENKSFEEHLKSLSSEEEEQNYSENGDSKKEQDVLSNHSNEEQFDSDDGKDEEEILSNHSEDSLSGSDSDSEDEEENDLEQTFATCKDKTDSNSDYDESSDNSDDSSGSDESGSLFNEDD